MGNRLSVRDLSEEERVALGFRVREVVEKIGTQSAAAEVACVSQRQLQQYVAGTVAPSLVAAGNLALKTGYSLDWILTGKGEKTRSGSPDPETHPGDAAVNEAGRIRDMLSQFRDIRSELERIGITLKTPADEEEVLDGIADAIDATGLPKGWHPALARLIAASCRVAADFAEKRNSHRDG